MKSVCQHEEASTHSSQGVTTTRALIGTSSPKPPTRSWRETCHKAQCTIRMILSEDVVDIV